MKLTHFIIGILLIGMLVVIFGTFASNVVIYSGVSGYNATEIDQYNKFSEIDNITKDIQTRSENIKTNRGIADIIGGFFADAKDVLDITSQSVSTFNSLTGSIFEKLGISALLPFIKTIIVVLIFLGVIIAILVGRDEV